MANHIHDSDESTFEITSRRRRGFPSETQVKRGVRVVDGNQELLEKLGRNDPCPELAAHTIKWRPIWLPTMQSSSTAGSRRSRSRFRVRPRSATRPVVSHGRSMTGRASTVS